MKIAVGLFLIVSMGVLPGAVQAQIVVCKDASGRTLTSDRPIPECADRTQRLMDRNGIVRREIPAPLTAQQKKEAHDQEERRNQEVAAQEKEKQNDRALLARYRTEKDIALSRKRSLDAVQDDIRRENALMASAQQDLLKAQKEADRYEDKDKDKNKDKAVLPAELQQRIEVAQKHIKESQILIQQRSQDLAEVGARFDLLLKRFQHLHAATSGVAR